jgi:hypothetical protein
MGIEWMPPKCSLPVTPPAAAYRLGPSHFEVAAEQTPLVFNNMTGAYHILPTDDIDSDDKHSQPHPSHSRFSRTVVVLLAIVLVETAAFATHVLYSRKPTSSVMKLYCASALFGVGCLSSRRCPAPAQDVVEDIVQFYAGGFDDDKTSFQIPSSPALDSAWNALYQRTPSTHSFLPAEINRSAGLRKQTGFRASPRAWRRRSPIRRVPSRATPGSILRN